MADNSLFFEDAPDQVRITPGSIPKQSIDEYGTPPLVVGDGVVVTGKGPDEYYLDEEKRNSLPNMEADLDEGEPIPMSGQPLEAPQVRILFQF